MASTSDRIPDWPGPNDPAEAERLSRLTMRLADADGDADEAGVWSETLWSIVREARAQTWTLPPSLGGEGCDRPTIIRRYAKVAEGSLTAAFILTQHDAAIRRLLPASGRKSVDSWLAKIGEGRAFTTVGISQLTTSRRHGAAALVASETPRGYRLEGVMPWVTGAERADLIVTGAVMEDGRQMLIAVPTDRPGLSVQPSFPLAALQASCTAEVRCDGVEVAESDLLAGPVPDVMSTPGAGGTGGLETSSLALGQARAALTALDRETVQRDDLLEPIEALTQTWSRLATDLIDAAEGVAGAPSPGEIRRQANSLVLRCTQAYLTARKGTGFLRTEPAQRWARQALFFLVWSCPGPVAQAAIRDLAGLCSA